jgi:hypothetical protein
VRLLLVCLLSGCWLAIQDPQPRYVSATGRCIQKERVGRSSYNYFHDGDELSSGEVERLVEKIPEERKTAVAAGHMRRAGWSFVVIGLSFLIAGTATLLATGLPDGSLPRWSEAVGGGLLAAWFPTMATGIALSGVSSIEMRDAVDRVNARGVCP